MFSWRGQKARGVGVIKERRTCERDRRGRVRERDRHLLDSGDVRNEGLIVYEVEKLLQLMEVRQEVVTNPLKDTNYN